MASVTHTKYTHMEHKCVRHANTKAVCMVQFGGHAWTCIIEAQTTSFSYCSELSRCQLVKPGESTASWNMNTLVHFTGNTKHMRHKNNLVCAKTCYGLSEKSKSGSGQEIIQASDPGSV